MALTQHPTLLDDFIPTPAFYLTKHNYINDTPSSLSNNIQNIWIVSVASKVLLNNDFDYFQI